MFKRVICWVAVVAVVLAFGGCADRGAKTSADKDNVTIKWYFASGTSQAGNDAVYTKANEVVKEKLGFRVDFKPLDQGTYEEKMKMIIAGGEEYDICWTSNWLNNYNQNVSRGSFLDIDELLDTKASELKATMSENIWNGARVNGKIYAVPNQQIMARATAVFIPTALYEKYSNLLQNIRKYEDLEGYFAALSRDFSVQPKVRIKWDDMCYSVGIEDVIGSLIPGSVYLNGDEDDIQVFNQYESKEWLELTRVRNSWYQKGYTMQGISPNTGDDKKLPDHELAMIVSVFRPGGDVEASKTYLRPMTMIQISEPYLTTQGITATLNAISSQSKHPEEAIGFLQLMNTDADMMNLVSFGIENEHYTKLDENTIKVIPNSGFTNPSWMMGNVFNTYFLEGQAKDIWTKTKEVNEKAKYSKLLGFNVNLDPIKVEANNCKSIINEYMPLLDNGIGDAAVHQEQMLEKLKAAGVDRLIAELQSQIDAWKAEK